MRPGGPIGRADTLHDDHCHRFCAGEGGAGGMPGTRVTVASNRNHNNRKLWLS